uniref:Uncharacterized protein n=1 Tax=Setaria digitata TaxID=48799 RepID=A0A915PG48_9BILA
MTPKFEFMAHAATSRMFYRTELALYRSGGNVIYMAISLSRVSEIFEY